MIITAILTVLSDDKPGVIEAIAETVAEFNGNWQESQLAQLAGKFAGVIVIRIDESVSHDLAEKLKGLAGRGIHITFDIVSPELNEPSGKKYRFRALGPDRSGIVKEISRALVQQGINVVELNTALSSMPYSGEPLFEASGYFMIPPGSDSSTLNDKIDELANHLAMDIAIEAIDENKNSH